jgi:hypothetical protein
LLASTIINKALNSNEEPRGKRHLRQPSVTLQIDSERSCCCCCCCCCPKKLCSGLPRRMRVTNSSIRERLSCEDSARRKSQRSSAAASGAALRALRAVAQHSFQTGQRMRNSGGRSSGGEGRGRGLRRAGKRRSGGRTKRSPHRAPARAFGRQARGRGQAARS